MMRPSRLTCEQTFRQLNDYLDRALSAEEMRLVEEHLETCAQCASEYRFESTFLDELRSKLQRIAMPDDVRSRLFAKLAADKKPGSPGS